jgi:hypothetical protein
MEIATYNSGGNRLVPCSMRECAIGLQKTTERSQAGKRPGVRMDFADGDYLLTRKVKKKKSASHKCRTIKKMLLSCKFQCHPK